jgi:hypothetical protein
MTRGTLWLLALAALALLLAAGEAKFSEELKIIPLAHHGHVALSFKFSVDWDADKDGVYPYSNKECLVILLEACFTDFECVSNFSPSYLPSRSPFRALSQVFL